MPAGVLLHIRLASLNIAIAATMGVLLGIDKVAHILPGFVLTNVFAHAHMAAIGWATMMVVGIGYRLIPMVLPAQPPTGRSLFISAGLLEAGVLGLFVALQEEGGRLLLAAPLAPAGLRFSLPDLGSRAAGALVYQVRGLAEEQRIIALQKHASFRGIDLPEPSARFLLQRVRRDMGALCRWLDTLDRASLAAQRKLTVPFIREHLT